MFWDGMFTALWLSAKAMGSELMAGLSDQSGVDFAHADPSSKLQFIADAVDLWASVFPISTCFIILLIGFVVSMVIRVIRLFLGLIPFEHG